MGVRCKIAGSPKTFELGAKPRKMRVRWRRDMNMGQRQPVLKALHNGFNGKRTRDHFAICRDSHESEHGRPCEPDALDASETPVPPSPRLLVDRKIGVMRVNEYVYVRRAGASLNRSDRPLGRCRPATPESGPD